jgi:hypothetical protein
MKSQINLNLSKRNRRAVLYLSAILFLIIYSPRLFYFFKKEEKISIHSFPSKKWIIQNKKQFKFDVYSQQSIKFKSLKFKKPPSKFDPNIYSEEDWILRREDYILMKI